MSDTLTRPRRKSRTRLFLGATYAAALAVAVTMAVNIAPAHAEADRTLTSSLTGTHNGYYFSFWKDSGDASMTLLADGRYTSRWNNSTNNWVGGKGWATGTGGRSLTRVPTTRVTTTPTSPSKDGPGTR